MRGFISREKIGEEIYFSTIDTDKFNTSRISVNLMVDLNRLTVTENALVAFLLRKGCAMYPDFTALNLRLDELYGAVISTDVRKFGDNQVINISATCINNQFALAGEDIRSELARLVCDILTAPLMENGLFLKNEIEIEKSVLCDTIRSVKDDKGAYVVERLVANMCENEPFGIAKYGYCEDMDRLTPERVTKCYNDIMAHSRIEIVCTGENINDNLKTVFTDAFSKVYRGNLNCVETKLTPATDAPRRIVEKLNITQSKVAMGFTTGISLDDDRGLALNLMSAIYGGTTSSKLFSNVREKMSLCYYCASGLDKHKGIMLAYSGVQEENREKVIEEMLSQFEEIRNARVTDQEIEQAKAYMVTAFESINDSLYGLEHWYLGQITRGEICSPEQEMEKLKKLTLDDVLDVAKDVKLKMVYSIIEGGEEE